MSRYEPQGHAYQTVRENVLRDNDQQLLTVHL
jgi:hypothetical protein